MCFYEANTTVSVSSEISESESKISGTRIFGYCKIYCDFEH
jgi:hypothetical protein